MSLTKMYYILAGCCTLAISMPVRFYGDLAPDISPLPSPKIEFDHLAEGSLEAFNAQLEYAESVNLPVAGQTKVTKIPLQLIPPGKYIRGYRESELGYNLPALWGRGDRYQRQREITIVSGFYIAATEITQKQWKSVMGPSYNVILAEGITQMSRKVPHKEPALKISIGDDFPAVFITPAQMQEFCDTLCNLEQVPLGTYRLPYSSEWEYACRAGTATPFYTGAPEKEDDFWVYEQRLPFLDVAAHYASNDDPPDISYKPAKVASKLPNAWGIYDMHGNVREVCLVDEAKWDFIGSDAGHKYHYRGGHIAIPAMYCRSGSYMTDVDLPGDISFMYRGFRIIKHSVINNCV